MNPFGTLTYRPVVDRFTVLPALDPPSAAIFATVFVVAALLTLRRPAYGLALLILATPVDFSHVLAGTTVTLSKAVLLGVLLGLSTFAGSADLLRRRPARLLLGALGALLVATLLTGIDAAHRGIVAREALKVVEYIGVFVAAFLCRALDGDDRALITATSIGALVVSFSALAQEIVGAPSGLYIGAAIIPRIAGLLEGPNQLCGYCEVAAATLGAWALVRRSLLIDAALALVICTAILTFSRAGWLALALIGAILVAWAGKGALRGLRPAFAGLAAGLAGAAGWAIYAHTPGVLRASLTPSLYAGGVGNRSELWRAAWAMWRAHPWLGVGAGNFEYELPAYGVAGVRTHANSLYLQALAEGGIALFLATLAVLVAVAASLLWGQGLRRLRAASPWVIAALAATLALAVHQVVDYLVFYPKVGGAWWLLVGIAAAALQ
ncbi:MAG: O-antigen ligase family protein [Caulobacteraceae bacterium]|nr:O-antigen ligase family protein [Caulobacteraceae bacterium]